MHWLLIDRGGNVVAAEAATEATLVIVLLLAFLIHYLQFKVYLCLQKISSHRLHWNIIGPQKFSFIFGWIENIHIIPRKKMPTQDGDYSSNGATSWFFYDKQKFFWPNTIRAKGQTTFVRLIQVFDEPKFILYVWNFVLTWIFLRSTKENHLFKIFEMEKSLSLSLSPSFFGHVVVAITIDNILSSSDIHAAGFIYAAFSKRKNKKHMPKLNMKHVLMNIIIPNKQLKKWKLAIDLWVKTTQKYCITTKPWPIKILFFFCFHFD